MTDLAVRDLDRSPPTAYLERVETARLADLAPSPDVKDDPPSGALGRDGASWYADAWQGGPDVNPELTGRAKYEVFREMRLSDPAVRSLDWLIKLPVRSADWGLVPATNDPRGDAAAKATADLVAKQFGLEDHDGEGRLDRTWDSGLQQSMMFVSMGAHGEELVWGDPEPWVDADGDTHIVRFLTRLAPRHVSSVSEIKVNATTGLIDQIEQDLASTRPIPGGKLVWYVMEDEGDPWGTSVYRSAWGAWLFKKGLLIGNAIAWDRFASGLVLVRHPPGAGAKKEAGEIGRGLRTHERAWVTLEGPPPSEGGDWDVKVETATINDPVALLRHYDAMIAMSGLQQFSSLGQGASSTSRAYGEVVVEPFYMAEQALADYIRLARQRFVIRRLIDVNFGAHIPAPKLRVSKIMGKNLAVLARALADLSAAGLSYTDRETQNDIRDIADLRHLPEPTAAAVAGLPEEVGITPAGVPVEGGPISRAARAGGDLAEVELESGVRLLLPRGLARSL